MRNPQIMGFRHPESDNGSYQTGLEMWQQPNTPSDVVNEKLEAANKITDETKRKAAIQALIDNNEIARSRLFLGKRWDNSTMLVMNNIKGKARIRMQVAPDDTPKLEFLDSDGNVTQTLSNAPGAMKK